MMTFGLRPATGGTVIEYTVGACLDASVTEQQLTSNTGPALTAEMVTGGSLNADLGPVLDASINTTGLTGEIE